MIDSFTPGTKVRWNIPNGGLAKILYYVKEGFYMVETIPEQRELITQENDLMLVKENNDE